MKLAVMQPYFFPYLGHFELIARVDRWVVFDTAQYIRRGWMHRNRVLHPDEGWWYINVPVARHDRDTPIHDIEISTAIDWRARLFERLAHYRDHAPFYGDTIELVEDCLRGEVAGLSGLNVRILAGVCAVLRLPFEPLFLSGTHVDPGAGGDPGQRVLDIARRLGASTYVNPEGGERLLDRDAFDAAGITLDIQRYAPLVYDTGPYAFEPGLSVIDALMWNSPETLRRHVVGETTRDAQSPAR